MLQNIHTMEMNSEIADMCKSDALCFDLKSSYHMYYMLFMNVYQTNQTIKTKST